MDIQITTQEGVTVIHVNGRLDGNSVSSAQDKIMPLVIGGCKLVIALCKCDYISSAGLRLLLMIAKQLNAQGGKWALACASEEIRDVMDMTGFSGFFQHYGTIWDAVSALK